MSYGTGNRYREMDVMAMTPARRLVMLYTHLLVQLRQARRHLEQGEIELRGERLLKAEEIVRELLISLNYEAGGSLARQLASLYEWLLKEFSAIHRKPDLKRLDAATKIVAELHEAWEGAANQLSGLAEAPAA
ncbi:MAG TPA: flagellar export chaperone FliS [Gemmatimonadales bacterium]|jgi:flagellar protein FliS